MTEHTDRGDAPSPRSPLGRLVITVTALGICALVGTGVVINGLVFGILLFVMVYTIATRVSAVRTLMRKHAGATDIVVTVGTFVILGGSATALVAGATVGCLTTVILTMGEWTALRENLDKGISLIERKLEQVGKSEE